MEKSTGVQSDIQVKPSYGLSDDEVTTMPETRWHMPSMIWKLVHLLSNVGADRVIEGLITALNADGGELLSPEKSAVTANP